MEQGLPADSSGRIILCDNDADELVFLQHALTNLGYNYAITWAPSGPDLLQYLDRWADPTDLIFLDFRMPGPTGLEILARIRRNVQWQNLRVIMYSLSNTSEVIDAAFALGAHRFLIKSYAAPNLEHLLEKIIALVSGGGLQIRTRENFCLQEAISH